ncbi:Hypothetical predicted protein [Mytilus galloprovincialis]|uniref:Tc1-like transposase DDE domain-containing protein n=1 Tax=Mytilus galloprovincialis TaxID=29158 RepID=A0A8B6CB79_MYTGA|nr:Hypothetical predicted protein [Mytilus galloprovincialis]
MYEQRVATTPRERKMAQITKTASKRQKLKSVLWLDISQVDHLKKLMNSLSYVDLLNINCLMQNYQFHRNNGQSRRQNQTRYRSTKKVGQHNPSNYWILRTRGHNISHHSVRYWLRAYDRGFISELCVYSHQNNEPSEKFLKDAELIKQIHKALVADGANLTLSITKIAIDAAGFTHSRPRYGQMMRRTNRPTRVDFSQHLIDDFADIIFSDETSIQTFYKTNYCREKDSVPLVHGKPKHPLKLHVLGAISRRLPSKVTIFEDIMEKEFFTNSILRDHLLSYVRVKFPDGHSYQQDNDPKHKSKMAKEFMNDNGINRWDIWPSESPDSNSIEMVWNQMKRHVARVDPKTKEELVNTLRTFWCEKVREDDSRAMQHVH